MPFTIPEHSAQARGSMLGDARPVWYKVIESEERMNWLKENDKETIISERYKFIPEVPRGKVKIG